MADVDYDWTGTDDDPWDPAVFSTIGNYLGSSPAPTIQGNKGDMVTGGTGLGISDRHAVIAYFADDYVDTEVIVSLRSMVDDQYPGIGWRVTTMTGVNPFSGYEAQWDTSVDNVNVLDNATNITVARALVVATLADHDATYRWRIYSRGDRHRIKWWVDGDDEPLGWPIDFVDATYTEGRAYLSTVNTNTGVAGHTVWDDAHVGEIVPPPPGIRIGAADLVGVHIAATSSTWDDVTACYVVGDDLEPVEVPVP